jgi:two-component system OmpR family response regulator
MIGAMQKTRKVLVVEDDRTLSEVLAYNLKREGYQVMLAVDGVAGLDAARREKPDLVVLDVMLPGLDGFEVCRILRKETSIPIIMLTAKGDESDKVVGLELGADDYITKPFSVKELLARIRAGLRRSEMVQPPTSGVLRSETLEVDPARHEVRREGKAVELTPREFDLLVYLMRNRGIVASRSQLLENVWAYDHEVDTKTVDVHIRWLRQKIEAAPSNPKLIITVRGSGYKFVG